MAQPMTRFESSLNFILHVLHVLHVLHGSILS
jgi:hypothetical protein